jgi:hypothetical protein
MVSEHGLGVAAETQTAVPTDTATPEKRLHSVKFNG